ncbi:MAG TPA: tRNA (adenosine(37)-N6)-threonylcarbamoyltransferase complex transferase subunit TsaD, partial [Candidatus Sumerlaeota bacterium]|nr:tRNA (adenosine(37)-N6)-threonylcarbamoyltransferase complex transferase subunit TsaD [Candidatus Sumerlaeota bacterium]
MNTPRAILGIETSCDETAVALVTREGRVLTSLVASQVDLHAAFGGVVPEVAARVHIQACLPLVERALSETATTWRNIEAVAVTYGPGLIGCLLVGIETAKTLAWVRGRPLVAVNHLAGHLHALQLAPAVGHHLLIEGGREFSVLPVALDPPAGAPASAPPPDRIARPAYPHVGL